MHCHARMIGRTVVLRRRIAQLVGEGRLAVPREMRSRIVEGATISVSVEPFGGSPTGRRTGPVLATGAARFD